MSAGRSFLIDTNIIIHLEDPRPVKADFSEMVRKCQERGVTLYVHESSEDDIRRDKDLERRGITLSKLAKFPRITSVPTPPETELEHRFGLIKNEHDRVDVYLLNAIDRKVTDFLVTEDFGIHKRAKLAGLQDRVFRVADALDWLALTFEPASVELPHIVERRCYQLDKAHSIFNTLRAGYPGFDEWIERNPHRPCWCLEVSGETAGVVIIKEDEPRSDTDATLPGDKILKISTFKVSEAHRGEKFGEHFLKKILWHAQRNGYDLVYITAIKDEQEILVALLNLYGFVETTFKARKDGRTEAIFEKPMCRGAMTITENPLADAYRQYPRFREDNAIGALYVPIRPQWYYILFPEKIVQPLLPFGTTDVGGERIPGNTIRKAYVCKAQRKFIKPGDILLFYMSGNETGSGAVRTVGIVENYREISNLEGLVHATGRRSVYGVEQLAEMLRDSPVKVLDFLLVGHLDVPIPREMLIKSGALNGVPQSITAVNKDAYQQLNIRQRLGYG